MTLLAGTLPGLTQTTVPETMLMAAVLVVAALRPPRVRLGGALQLWLLLAFAVAVLAPCPARSLHLAVRFTAAAAFFVLLQDGEDEKRKPMMAAIATGAAMFGIAVWLMGLTPRVLAPFGLHHYAAGFLLLHLPLTVSLARRFPLWWLAGAVQVAAIAGTRSLAAVAALAVLCLWPLRRRPVWVAGIALVLVALAVYVPRTRSLLERGEDPSLSVENRVRYLRTGFAMIEARPWGWGLGSTPLVPAPYRPQVPDVMPQGEALPHLHNLPVHVAAEMGVLAPILATILFWQAFSPGLLAYAVLSLADYQLDLPALLFALAAVMALAVRPRDGALQPVWRMIFLMAAAAAPIQSTCGWEDFEKGNYTAAAARIPDLIPVSAAAGASLLESAKAAEAIPHLERATQLDRYFTLAHYHLGRARLAVGNRGAAVEAFAQGLLAQPVTVFADGWEVDIYRQAMRRALSQLGAMPPAEDPRTRHRFAELRAFLRANQEAPPVGSYRRVYSEITDGDLDHNTSLQVFRHVGAPKYTSGIVVSLPQPDFYIPPGIGFLPHVKAAEAPLPVPAK